MGDRSDAPPPIPSLADDEITTNAISGWLDRHGHADGQWARRWLQSHGHVICTFSEAPHGALHAKVLHTIDLREMKDVILLEESSSDFTDGSSFAIVPPDADQTRTGEVAADPHMMYKQPSFGIGYVFRAESPAAASRWVRTLKRIRDLDDDGDEPRPYLCGISIGSC